jgi:hypothetical protein
MSLASAVLAPMPSRVRSKITNDPAQRHGRSAEARRVKDLFAGYSAALGNPSDAPTTALILAAAEAVTIAEIARRDHIAGKVDLNSVIRAEGAANRALKRLGLAKPATAPRKTFTEKMMEAEAAKAAEAGTATDAPPSALTTPSSDEPGSQAEGAAA